MKKPAPSRELFLILAVVVLFVGISALWVWFWSPEGSSDTPSGVSVSQSESVPSSKLSRRAVSYPQPRGALPDRTEQVDNQLPAHYVPASEIEPPMPDASNKDISKTPPVLPPPAPWTPPPPTSNPDVNGDRPPR